jgi:hypothetical protein
MKKLANAVMGGLVLAIFASGLAYAKLPPPTEAQKMAAEQKKEQAAAAAKKEAETLAKVEDRIAANYIKEMKAKGITVNPTIPPSTPAAATEKHKK